MKLFLAAALVAGAAFVVKRRDSKRKHTSFPIRSEQSIPPEDSTRDTADPALEVWGKERTSENPAGSTVTPVLGESLGREGRFGRAEVPEAKQKDVPATPLLDEKQNGEADFDWRLHCQEKEEEVGADSGGRPYSPEKEREVKALSGDRPHLKKKEDQIGALSGGRPHWQERGRSAHTKVANGVFGDQGERGERGQGEVRTQESKDDVLEVEWSRSLGGVEENWVRAVSSGTGVCVVMIVIARTVKPWQVEYAGRELQRRHAMMRSWIVFDKHGKPRFEVCRQPFVMVSVEEVTRDANGGATSRATDGTIPDWQQVLEKELNTPIPKMVYPPGKLAGSCDPSEERAPALGLKLHFLSGGRCSVALQIHTATCDYAATALVASEYVNILDQIVAHSDAHSAASGGVGMKRVFSNAGLHQEDEWEIGEPCESAPGGNRMRRTVSHHRLHRNASTENLRGGGVRRVQSAVHLDRGFGSFMIVGDLEPDCEQPLKPLNPRAESPNSALLGPMSASTSTSSLSPEQPSNPNSFSRVPTENGKPLYDVSEFPPLKPLAKDSGIPNLSPLNIANGGLSPPTSPSFSTPMSFASARSLPLSPGSSPGLSPSPSFAEFPSAGGVDLAAHAPPPSPSGSPQSLSEAVAIGLIDPFAKQSLPCNETEHKHTTTRSNSHRIDAPPIDSLDIEFLKEASNARPCIEDLVDKNRAKKPFWAKGKDLVGYSVGSLGKPLLAFQPGWSLPFRTQVVSSILPQAPTQALLSACTSHNTSLYGALSASCFKAVAASKRTGFASEVYSVTTMVNCRSELRHPLQDSDVGFFHSALMHHHSVAESTEFWELAKRCSSTLERALEEDKHFKDMGVLNLLFTQAMQHPNLTPQSSLRTSVLCAFSSSVHVPLPTTSTLELTNFIGCASVHGVGPCIGIFSFMINGNLHYCLAFPTPLFAREQVAWVNERMRETLEACADA